jgi:hypothetical protein
MQSFLNGADCATNANPLNQVLKREGVDNSLYRVRAWAARFASRADAREIGPIEWAELFRTFL